MQPNPHHLANTAVYAAQQGDPLVARAIAVYLTQTNAHLQAQKRASKAALAAVWRNFTNEVKSINQITT